MKKTLRSRRGPAPSEESAGQALPNRNHQHSPDGIEDGKRPDQLKNLIRDGKEKLRRTANPEVTKTIEEKLDRLRSDGDTRTNEEVAE